MALLTTFLGLISSGRNDPASDIIPFSGAATFNNGCRAIRCVAAGSFTGITIAGNSRTVAMAVGDLLPVGFLSITSVGSGTYEALL